MASAQRHRALARALTIALALAGTAGVRPAGAILLPPQFVAESVGPAFDRPVALAFLPDGALLVGEKRGRVWVLRNGVRSARPLWSAESEVLDNGDRGLLGIAVDPNYSTNRRVYFLYTVDPDGGDDTNDDAFGRLTRYRVSLANPDTVDLTSRAVLMGANWNDSPPSGSTTHAIGALRWGRDGSLMISVGEGAQYTSMDPGGKDPAMFSNGRTDPIEDIGAFRAQFLGSLGGKLLRIDPSSGLGYASNPFASTDLGSPQSRIWAYGLRNPFRFALKPLTGETDASLGRPGTFYIADVGWRTWEEIDVADQAGRNFGWPCYEGFGAQIEYQQGTPEHHGCGTIGTPENPSPHRPPITEHHHTNPSLSTPPGIEATALSGIAFYTGFQYPQEWRNLAFFSEYGGGTIQALVTDASDRLVQVMDFAAEAGGPVDLVADPASGDLHYLSLDAGMVMRVRFTGTVAVAPPAPPAKHVWLSEARPNPTTGRVQWWIELPEAGPVSLSVLDAVGREVWRERTRLSAGRWPLVWSGMSRAGPAAPGIYLARVETRAGLVVRRFALVR